MRVKLALIGFGTVGQGLAEILRDKAAELANQYDFQPVITAVATRTRGTLYHPDGLVIDSLLDAIQRGHLSHYPDTDGLERDWSVDRLIQDGDSDVLVEASVSNLETGQPATNLCQMAFAKGKHVVLANKGPVAVSYRYLKARAEQADAHFRFEATVMAGTPALSTALEGLAGATIQSVRGILNGTCNYILTQMEAGQSYSAALQAAQEKGYAEADPTADVGGWDTAGKLLILAAALFNANLTMNDLNVTGITALTSDQIHAAKQEGKHWKLIGTVTPNGGRVEPVALELDDPLASVGGTNNAVTYRTDLLGDVTLIGPGAGKQETGAALLADLLAIHQDLKNT